MLNLTSEFNENLWDNCTDRDNAVVAYYISSRFSNDFPKIVSYRYLMRGMCLTIMVLNLLVIFSVVCILRRRTEPRATYLYMGNIALIDFCTGLYFLVGLFYPAKKRNYNECTAYIGIRLGCYLISVYSVLLIAIDRFIYILYGMKYLQIMTSSRTYFLCLLTWIAAIIVAFIPVPEWYHPDYGQMCWVHRVASRNLILLTTILVSISVSIVVILYIILIIRVLQRNSIMKSSESDDGYTINGMRIFFGSSSVTTTSHDSSHWKGLGVIFLTATCFCCTWFPYVIRTCYTVLQNEVHGPNNCKDLIAIKELLFQVLVFLNPVLNPMIYAWWHPGFQENINKIFNRSTNKL